VPLLALSTALPHDGRPADIIAGAPELDARQSPGFWRDLGICKPATMHPAADARTRSARPPEDRVDLVSIVTPNSSHHTIAKAFVSSGFNVVTDKPMVVTTEQPKTWSRRQGLRVVFASPTTTPATRLSVAPRVGREGKLGKIRKVLVEYHQGWLSTKLEDNSGGPESRPQAGCLAHRSFPGRRRGAIGHRFTRREPCIHHHRPAHPVCLRRHRDVHPRRRLDDDGAVLLRFEGGARGLLSVSQVCIGEENNLTIRVYGSEASLSCGRKIQMN